jgi:hypothetical protein
MKKIKILFITLYLLTMTTACGFKAVYQQNLINFEISDLEITGDRRINYKIKNKLAILNSENKKQSVKIKIVTKKKKSIKEKNDKNEITKFQLDIEFNVQIIHNNIGRVEKFLIKRNGDYSVSSRYSNTLDSEKRVTNLLTDDMLDEMIDKLNIHLNDI